MGWSLTADSTKANYMEGDLYTSREDLVLYAIYEGTDSGEFSETRTQTMTAN